MEDAPYIYTDITEKKETRSLEKIIVVRHGESIANTQGIYQGQTYDTDLSELGKKQAKALATRVCDLGIKRIISSPLKRTYQTAMEVSAAINIPIEINTMIIETNHGVWEGMKKKWIEERFPDVHKNWLEKPGETQFPGGENFMATFDRVNNFLDNLEITDGTLIVTHDNIIRILIAIALGTDINDIWKHEVEPASLNFFELNMMDGKRRIKTLKLNDNEHLQHLHTDLAKHAL